MISKSLLLSQVFSEINCSLYVCDFGLWFWFYHRFLIEQCSFFFSPSPESPDWEEDCQEYPVTHSSSNLPIEKVKYSRLIVMKCLLSEYVREKNGSNIVFLVHFLLEQKLPPSPPPPPPPPPPFDLSSEERK